MTTKAKRPTEIEPQPEQHVRLRIICLSPPNPEKHSATFGLQDNSTTKEWVIHPGVTQANGDVHFECECRVRVNPRTKAPNFLGPFVHGGTADRFLYLSWRPKDWRPGQEVVGCPWLRRTKVRLGSITWVQIKETIRKNGVLEAKVVGTGRNGGPFGGSVPLAGSGWTIRKT